MRADFSQALKRAQEFKGTNGGQVFLALLKAHIDALKEELVSASPDAFQGIQGAIQKTRSLVTQIERDTTKMKINETRGRNGGFR